MITHNQVIRAVKMIDQYCSERMKDCGGCGDCIFNDVMCPCGFTGTEWEQVKANAERLEKGTTVEG